MSIEQLIFNEDILMMVNSLFQVEHKKLVTYDYWRRLKWYLKYVSQYILMCCKNTKCPVILFKFIFHFSNDYLQRLNVRFTFFTHFLFNAMTSTFQENLSDVGFSNCVQLSLRSVSSKNVKNISRKKSFHQKKNFVDSTYKNCEMNSSKNLDITYEF